MLHELIAPYYTGGDTRDLKEHIDEVRNFIRNTWPHMAKYTAFILIYIKIIKSQIKNIL